MQDTHPLHFCSGSKQVQKLYDDILKRLQHGASTRGFIFRATFYFRNENWTWSAPTPLNTDDRTTNSYDDHCCNFRKRALMNVNVRDTYFIWSKGYYMMILLLQILSESWSTRNSRSRSTGPSNRNYTICSYSRSIFSTYMTHWFMF